MDNINIEVTAVPEVVEIVISEPVDGIEFVPATHVVYVEKTGLDANGGLTPDKPKLTIAASIVVASALIVSGATHVRIEVLDGGQYTESISLPSGVTLHAPAATLIGSIGLASDARVVIDKHYASNNNQNLIDKSGGSGHGFYRSNITDMRGIAGAFTGGSGIRNTSNGSVLFAHIGVLYVGANGVGVSDGAPGFGHIHFWTPDLYLAGNNAVGISAQNNSNFIGYIDHILEINAPTGTIGIRLTNAGAIVKTVIAEIIADTVYSITNGSLHIIASRISGLRVGNPVFEMTQEDIRTKRLILTSPNGTLYAVTVSNAGVLAVAAA